MDHKPIQISRLVAGYDLTGVRERADFDVEIVVVCLLILYMNENTICTE